DANREEIALGLKVKLSIAFQALGFDITDFRIEGTDFDDDTLKRVNRIADLNAEAQAAQAAGVDYAKLQHLEAMREAARNEGGGAGMGLGLGAGIGLGQQMAQTLTEPAALAQPVANDTAAKLTQLKQLFTAELISADEYAAKKKAILDSL
ncbi:MAG: SPFH domain-containing protein, partial [Methylococcaceae bacterium]|nr:SPFH domain-containing protein [Methylococcaceae bacterium]